MKRIGYIIALSFMALLAIGCQTLSKDPADDIVGDYNYTDNYYLKWGGDAKSATYNGSFKLTKISANKVQMTGDWNTTGTITGSTIQFDFCPQTDSQGYCNYTFGAGIIGATNMTFSYTGTGYRTYTNGVSYPWNTSGNVYAWRIR